MAYDCGYHIDVLGKKLPLLENKAILSVTFTTKEYGPGRGSGYGPKAFCYALLYWKKNNGFHY